MDRPSEEELKQALEAFAEAYLQTLEEGEEDSSEPFAAYELALRIAIHKNSDQFKKRFVNGYFALLEEEGKPFFG